jgi:hypothetical protein
VHGRYCLHIVDTLEIARAFGLSTHPLLMRGDDLDASVEFDPYRAPDMGSLIDAWLPLSLALNSLNTPKLTEPAD